MILKVSLDHWTANNDSRSIQRVSNRVEQIEEAVDDFDDTEAYKSRANHRSCRKRCKFYYSRFLSRNNQHCCYHDFCFQRGGKKCFISTKRKVKGLHRKRRTKYWLDIKKFIEFHGYRRVTFQYNYMSKESISFQKTVLVSQQEFRISKNLEEDLAGRPKTGGTFINPLCQPITKKKKKKMKQCSPEGATIAYPTPANKVVEMNHTKKTKSTRRKKRPVNPIPATCSNVSQVKSSTRNKSVLSLGSGQPQKKKGSTFQSVCKGTVTVFDLIHSKTGQCMPFVSTMPSLGPTHSMHGYDVVSKHGTHVPIPLHVSPTISSSSLVSKQKGSNKASKSQSNPLGIVSSTSNGREGHSNRKLDAPANSKVKRPLLIPASSSSCNSLSPEVPISAPHTTKPGLSVSQATNVSFDDSAVHFNMQSKRYHSEHKHMTLESSQFLPGEKPSIYKPVSFDHPVPELALPELSIVRSQPTPTMMPSIVALSEFQSPSFRPVLKSNTSCTAIEVGNVTQELALDFAAVSRMNNSKSIATPPNYQTKQQSLIDMSRLEPYFETEMSLSETAPFHATLQGTASHQDQFQRDQWKSTSTISESKHANSKSKPIQDSKQISKASTIEVVTVEDETRRSLHDKACPTSLVPTEEKSVKCAMRTQTKCQEPKDLQIHGNHYECKSVCDKRLSGEQARVTMSQATPTIFTVSNTMTKLPECRRRVSLKELFEDNIVPFAPSILPPQAHIEDSLSGVGCATTKIVAGVHQLADIEGVLCMKKGIASKISTCHEDQTQSLKVTNACRPEKEKPSQKSLITKKQASIELSKDGIKSIILDVMIANGISSQDIPCERKFDKDKVSPYSLRFFATKEMAQFYCSKCKQNSHSMAYCYLDLKTSSICHRFLKDCKHCKNWTRPTFRADAIETMAQNSVRQYFIFKTKSPKHN